MNDHIKGCGNDDKPLTLYLIPSIGKPRPLSGGYYHVRCGYRPPSKIKNGILLCYACVAQLGLPSLCDVVREAHPSQPDSHQTAGPPPPDALP